MRLYSRECVMCANMASTISGVIPIVSALVFSSILQSNAAAVENSQRSDAPQPTELVRKTLESLCGQCLLGFDHDVAQYSGREKMYKGNRAVDKYIFNDGTFLSIDSATGWLIQYLVPKWRSTDTDDAVGTKALSIGEAFEKAKPCLRALGAPEEYNMYEVLDPDKDTITLVYDYTFNGLRCVRRHLVLGMLAKSGRIWSVYSDPVFEPIIDSATPVASCTAVETVSAWLEETVRATHSRVTVKDCSLIEKVISGHRGSFCKGPRDDTLLEYCWAVPFEMSDPDSAVDRERMWPWEAYVSCSSGIVIADIPCAPKN